MSFAIYIMALLAIRFYVLEEAAFWPDDIKMHLWVSYTLIIAPAINAVLHITYDEVGSPWTRFAMWIHTLIHMIFIPIMIFVIL